MVKRNVDIAIRARDQASKKFRNISKATGGMTRAFRGAAAAAATFLSARALVRFSKSVIAAASDTEEINSKFSAVFKELTEQADAWAISFAESVGRSNLEIKTFLATLQDTFVPLGFARDRAKEMAEAMTELAVDIASFNNKADADVIRDLQSAIVGNTETVRKYGVIITQVTLGQELLNSGMAKGVKDATEAQKAQARLNIIQRSTTDAQGDAIRTASGYANQVKRLQANLTNLKVTIGNRILPSVNRFTTAINKNFDVVEKWSLRVVDFVTKVKNGFVDFAKFMKNDFTNSMKVVWDSFLILLKAAFDSAVILAADGGRRAGKAFRAGISGIEPATPTQTAAFTAAGGQTFRMGDILAMAQSQGKGETEAFLEFKRTGFTKIGRGREIRNQDIERFRSFRAPNIGPTAFSQAGNIFSQAFSDIRATNTLAQSGPPQRQSLRTQARALQADQRTESLLAQILDELRRQNLSVPGSNNNILRLSTAQG